MSNTTQEQDAYDRGYKAGAQREPEFKPEGEPDDYRDIWNGLVQHRQLADDPNLAALTFSVSWPGHDVVRLVDAEQLRHILAWLSEQES